MNSDVSIDELIARATDFGEACVDLIDELVMKLQHSRKEVSRYEVVCDLLRERAEELQEQLDDKDGGIGPESETHWLEELISVLNEISYGSPVTFQNDRYIVVENPDYEEDNGKDPCICVDVWEVTKLLRRMERQNPGPLEATSNERR